MEVGVVVLVVAQYPVLGVAMDPVSRVDAHLGPEVAVVVLAAAAEVVLEVTVVLDPGLAHVAEAHSHADLDPGPDHGAGQDPGLDLVPGQGPSPGRGLVVGAALDREVSAEVAPDHGPVLGPEVAAGVVPGPRRK